MIVTKRNKIILEKHEIDFIKKNHGKMTNRAMANHLGLRLTRLRTFCYEMGLKQMEMQYWTPEQVQFLKANYKTIGDTELAEIFSAKWHKDKGWDKKHIEKKRRYLKLKRSKRDIKNIHRRNVLMGRFKLCPVNAWITRGGAAPIGTKRVRFTADNLPYLVIKTKQGFVHYNRWLWQKHKGDIPEGTNICLKEGADRIEYDINDLEILTNAELSSRNSQKRIPPEYKEAHNLIKQIEKLLIKNQ